MSFRIKEICRVIKPCRKLADVGCDHGLITYTALTTGKCEYAFISDISKDCLKKAQELLGDYIADGIVKSAVSDGLKNVDDDCDSVVIAGMGGEEIIKILTEAPFLPENLYLQPMKNSDRVRKYLLQNGYGIITDYTFEEGKYYDYIIAKKGEKVREYSQDEIIFGRDNLVEKGEAFIRKIKNEIDVLETANQNMEDGENRNAVLEKIKKLREVIS